MHICMCILYIYISPPKKIEILNIYIYVYIYTYSETRNLKILFFRNISLFNRIWQYPTFLNDFLCLRVSCLLAHQYYMIYCLAPGRRIGTSEQRRKLWSQGDPTNRGDAPVSDSWFMIAQLVYSHSWTGVWWSSLFWVP